MKGSKLLISTLLLGAKFTYGTPAAACSALQSALPGRVFFPGSDAYTRDNAHFTQASSQDSTCSVEPESADDVSTILRIVSSGDTQSPFAVKGAGHTGNVGFSSTTGVQIALSRFNAVEYDASTSTVKIGGGQIWSDVYTQLAPSGVKVVGGRVPGVGVGGLALGGGYSYHTDQYGLTVDTIVSHDLVMPNGTFVTVTNETDSELFFALKGGFNNFGIVTSFTLQAHPQTDVWSATVNYPVNASSTVNPMIENWSTSNTDLKGVILSTYGASGTNEDESFLSVQLFYDAPTPPGGLFDGFLNVPGANVNLIGTTSFPAALGTLNGAFGGLNPPRTIRNTVPITHYTVGILDEMKAQLQRIVNETRDSNRSFISLVITTEPFVQPNAHSTDSAYPHPSDRFVCPSVIELDWQDPASDEFFVNLVAETQQAIQTRAIQEGQSSPNAILYNNYAPANTPLELIYGDNLSRLREVKRRVDPENVMGLAGGFKIDP
ncbi:FAD-binding domain-containing protein [Moniliophthora roreri MCA 2997]|uniref:FAD-binding domain-containing protein n=2 Tax=Moniliophthora roreri TaxID=221103 RepID=V2WCE4_MONRO|nr:FAD-binding domain-containing protein [Moniliophthora roreri MCA 2997]KAI3616276.1 FAD-binding domain-containing protein [Moniliophthora roreri]